MVGSARRRWIAAIGGLLALASASVNWADEPRWADYFGFLPLEVYKLDPRINNLLLADVDGDKVADVIVANNARSRIDLLLSSPGPAGDAGAEPVDKEKREANQVPSDHRMHRKSLSVNREIVSLQAGDFNGDGKIDLAYYGTPAELVILLNQGGGEFAEARKIHTGESIESAGALTVGDLNRDGKDDLALVTLSEVITILQVEGGKLGEPERLAHTSANPRMVKALDLDGDGGDDLVMLDGGTDDPIRVRFSAPGGALGPEERFAIEPLRAYTFGQVDGKPGQEFLTIEAQSGKASVMTLAEADPKDEDAAKRGRLLFYPLPQGGSRNRSLDLGDLDGNGKTDVVVADPANAQFLVYLQADKGGLGAPKTFPNLNGGKSVQVADLDGDKKAEVYVLSEPEKQVGRSLLRDGRLTFPAPLPIKGEPVSLVLADLDGDGSKEVIYVTREQNPKSTADAFALRALTRSKEGRFSPFRWGDVELVPLPEVIDAPTIKVLDVNRDGKPDLMLFNDSGPKSLRLGRGNAPPEIAPGGLGPLTDVPPTGLSLLELGGEPALVLAQKTYARNLVFDKDGLWVVKDQFNTGRNNAQVLGVAAIDTDGDGSKELALLDRTSKSILYLDKKDGVYRPSGSLSVGSLDFQGMRVADLDGDGKDDLLLAGAERFGVVLSGKRGRRLKVIASYEPTREDARLADLAAGDLNGDGQVDIALTDPGDHFVELTTYVGKPKLAKALAFKIFERKSFRRVSDLIEPRDLAISDVDGDRRSDLILLVHDRILIYRQDSGEPAKKVAEARK